MNSLNTQPFDKWADLVARNDEQKIIETFLPLMDKLTQMHEQKRAHGHIRPKHLTVSNHGYIDLSQFEAAASSDMDRSSVYAPPEAFQDPPPAPTIPGDIYAVAAVLYRAICGQSPVLANNRSPLGHDRLPMRANLGNPIADALNRGLALQPEARPASITALRDLLQGSDKALTTSPAALREEVKETCAVKTTSAANPAKPEAQSPPPPYSAGQTAPAVSQAATPLPPAPITAKRLPSNLTVGRPVEIPIAKLVTDPGPWHIDFLNAKELGLPFDKNKQALVGTPNLAGEHELQLTLILPEANGRPPLSRSIAVTVNPDPDSLWKNLPSDEQDPYFKPDTNHKDTVTPHARIVAASLRGRSHAHEGLFRDDDFRVRFSESSSWHLLTAADGAGSAKFARRGSQLACEVALGFMENWLTTQSTTLEAAVQAFVEKKDDRPMRAAVYSWLAGAAFDARKAILLEAETKNPPATLRDYHTTILLAVAKPTEAGWVIASFSIGDGAIALRRVNGEPKSLCTPDSGEFSGQTVFLTASNVLSNFDHINQRIHTALASDLSALVLMTDGVTDPKFPTEASLTDVNVWDAFWSEVSSSADFRSENKDISEQLLKWLAFRSPGNHDDRTIVVLLPLETLQEQPPASPKPAPATPTP